MIALDCQRKQFLSFAERPRLFLRDVPFQVKDFSAFSVPVPKTRRLCQVQDHPP
jgi:hypothetical protein